MNAAIQYGSYGIHGTHTLHNKEMIMNNPSLSRRKFLSSTAQVAVIAGVLTPHLGSKLFAMSKSVSAPMKSITLDLNLPEYQILSQIGGAVKISAPDGKQKPIIVSRISATQVAAYSSKCTHLGCEVSLPENNVINCPCHGSTFDGSGRVTHGPAGKDLKAFTAVLDGTKISITE